MKNPQKVIICCQQITKLEKAKWIEVK